MLTVTLILTNSGEILTTSFHTMARSLSQLFFPGSIRASSRILEWGHRSSAKGASIEAPGAPRGMKFGEGVSPSPMGVGSGEEAVPPSPEKNLIFWLKIVHFGVYSDKNSQFIRPIAGLNKMLSYRRETALQGAL